ncbi:MAG: UPF0182 family protein [Clostridiales bacterium]|nr:UPF0182 family protein [Clostridiales bacterium]
MKKKKKRGLTGVVVVLVLLLALFVALINFITDILWFIEMGYLSVFLRKLVTQLEIGVPAFLIIGLLSFLYLQAIKRGYNKKIESHSNDPGIGKRLNMYALAVAAVFSGLVTFYAVTHVWFEALKFNYSTSFGIADPLYNLDVSFYIFKLELIKQLNNIAIGVIIGFAAITVLYYMILISFRKPQIFEEVPPEEDEYEDDEERYSGEFKRESSGAGNFGSYGLNDILEKLNKFMAGGGFAGAGAQQNINRAQKPQKRLDDDNFLSLLGIASKQIIFFGVLFFLMLGVKFFLMQYDLLYSNTGSVVYGASYTDVNITLWMYRVLIGLSVLGAAGFVWGFSKKKFRNILAVPVIMVLVGLFGMGGAWLVQNYIVSPDELNKERPYLKRNIQFTQTAYGLNHVTEMNFPARTDVLDWKDIDNNNETISNIRINDYQPVKKYYNNVQTIRPYYLFTDVFVDRYMINGEYTQTFISAREINDSGSSPIPQTWLNKHIKYTHGYGITLSRVDKITANGQPDMLIRNIPPMSQVKEIDIRRPEIYFGRMTNDYILVKTDEKEFDYPMDAEHNAETIYAGTAGIPLNFLNKTMFSIRERNLRILVSTNLTKESKIVINRNVIKRVQTIMPMLTYDPDPYMVTVDGKLYWIVDAYTSSSYYPYSYPYFRGGNYIRNSIKVVIDAYNGATNYYIVDPQDPIAATYKKIFPALFKDFDDMDRDFSFEDKDASLRAHVRYPSMMLNIQANVFQRYHMNDEVMFYQNEDLWDIAQEIYETSLVSMVPNYYIMRLPHEEKAEFVNSIPYTPRDKLNMTALLVARNDMPHYGDIVLYRLPKGEIVYGPMQIEAQIDQHTEISKEFSLWSQAGSTYNRGNMFVVPIEESLLYIEPVYLEATNSSIPEVKRVIVAYGDKIAYRATLAEALDELFPVLNEKPVGSAPPDTPGRPITSMPPGQGAYTTAELINLASEAFDKAQAAQKNGDWAAYGQYLDQLERYLGMLKNNE